ncbi:sensor histidine kinase [Ruminococcus sp.]|uniref:sensor histidine kinase n=1 Tax=Ruminococcus sp. TaxID=41978 RepID=UPI00388D6E68
MKRKVFVDCMKKNKLAIVIFAVMTVLNGAVFLLYDVMEEPFIYAEVLLLTVLILLFGIDYTGELRSACLREDQKNSVLLSNSACGDTLRDQDYSEMIGALSAEINQLQTGFSVKKQADNDYYTAWVHLIKTPIATMKLLLSENSEEHRALSAELFRIEQYVEMVLDYIRLESDVNDLVIKEYVLDELIRETLRKFAPQFILRKLKLVYEPTDQVVVTDKKWLTFILDQLISNAIKYTPEGEIRVSVEGNKVKISDTGIGIAPEDIPRIFEKGYTGANGRIGQKSSGLGLFLSKKAANLLSVRIDVASVQTIAGSGSTFSLSFPEHSVIRNKHQEDT